MNTLDRIIAYVSPERGMLRARARNATRIYEGASGGRRAEAFRSRSTSANVELQQALSPLRDRARDLVRNSPLAARILDIIPSHACGTGIHPISTIGSDKLDKLVQQLWEDWQAKADITGRQTFQAQQVLACRSMIESGETLFRFIDTPMDNKSAVPLKLQLLEADFIDHYRDGLYGGSAYRDVVDRSLVKRTRMGVALGDYDRPVGLWLWKYHPGDQGTLMLSDGAYQSEFVSMDELLHVYRVLRPGQVRGQSWFAPVIATARELADFLDAVNVKARVEACFSAFITNDDSSMPLLDVTPGESDGTSGTVPGITTLQPGMIKELRAGQKVEFAAPSSTSQIEPILLYNQMMMAAGVGCTYDQASGDLRQANYSSLRAGKLDFWRLIGQLQEHTLKPQVCQPVWDRFISRAILSGRLKARDRLGGYPCEWVVPSKEAIDPKKDLDAEKNEVRAGRVTPQAFIASRGGNWRTNITDLKAYIDFCHANGVVTDIDASTVDQRGRKNTTPNPDDPTSHIDAQDAQDQADDAQDAADEKENA